MQVSFSSDEKHQQSLELLRQVHDYLSRLPPHPMHREMAVRVAQHLAEPTHRLVQRAQTTREGWNCNVAGLTFLGAQLVGDDLRVAIPEKHAGIVLDRRSGKTLAQSALNKLLSHGISMKLELARERSLKLGWPWERP